MPSPSFRKVPRHGTAPPPFGVSFPTIASLGNNSEHPTFGKLSRKAQKMLTEMSHPVVYPAGATIFARGDVSRSVHILDRGQVKLVVSDPNLGSNPDRNSDRVILKIFAPGEILGLDTIVLDRPYLATAETLTPAEAVLIRKEDFMAFLDQHAKARVRAAMQLAETYLSIYRKISSTHPANSTTQKLARFLMHRSSESKPAHGAIRVELPLTHHEVAQAIGASRETITRLMASFKRQHIAELHHSVLSIQDQAALARIASS